MYPAIEAALTEKVLEGIKIANEKLKRNFPVPLIGFSLSGTRAGTEHPKDGIQFNLEIAKANFQDFLNRTPLHELSHWIVDHYYGWDRKPHGFEWKFIMRNVFGLEPVRTHTYDISQVKRRRTKIHKYNCDCILGIKIGTKYHKLIQQGHKCWCRRCKKVLTPDLYLESVDKHPRV